MAERMTNAEIDAFLHEPHLAVAVLGTVGQGGAPHISPLWFLWEDGAAYIFTRRSTQKWRNMQADARVSLCVDHREPPYAAVILEGRIEEVTAPAGILYDYVDRMSLMYYGPEEGPAFAAGYRAEQPDAALLRLVPERMIGHRF